MVYKGMVMVYWNIGEKLKGAKIRKIYVRAEWKLHEAILNKRKLNANWMNWIEWFSKKKNYYFYENLIISKTIFLKQKTTRIPFEFLYIHTFTKRKIVIILD